MTLRLGDIAPDFTANTSMGEISLHDWSAGSWVFLFSHPADFTAVCTTEMGMTAQYAEDFAKRNVKPLGLSTDTVDEHVGWIEDINEAFDTDVQYPIIADPAHKVAKLYDMLHPATNATEAIRAVFIIDPANKIRMIMYYPMNVGRNFDEILRIIDALQIADEHVVSIPANWKPGDAVVVPKAVTTEEAQEKFSNLDIKKPYLRYTKLD